MATHARTNRSEKLWVAFASEILGRIERKTGVGEEGGGEEGGGGVEHQKTNGADQ